MFYFSMEESSKEQVQDTMQSQSNIFKELKLPSIQDVNNDIKNFKLMKFSYNKYNLDINNIKQNIIENINNKDYELNQENQPIYIINKIDLSYDNFDNFNKNYEIFKELNKDNIIYAPFFEFAKFIEKIYEINNLQFKVYDKDEKYEEPEFINTFNNFYAWSKDKKTIYNANILKSVPLYYLTKRFINNLNEFNAYLRYLQTKNSIDLDDKNNIKIYQKEIHFNKLFQIQENILIEENQNKTYIQKDIEQNVIYSENFQHNPSIICEYENGVYYFSFKQFNKEINKEIVNSLIQKYNLFKQSNNTLFDQNNVEKSMIFNSSRIFYINNFTKVNNVTSLMENKNFYKINNSKIDQGNEKDFNIKINTEINDNLNLETIRTMNTVNEYSFINVFNLILENNVYFKNINDLNLFKEQILPNLLVDKLLKFTINNYSISSKKMAEKIIPETIKDSNLNILDYFYHFELMKKNENYDKKITLQNGNNIKSFGQIQIDNKAKIEDLNLRQRTLKQYNQELKNIKQENLNKLFFIKLIEIK